MSGATNVQRDISERPSGLLVCKPSLRLVFEPAAWAPYKETTNCLTYALNCPDMGWMRPGGFVHHGRKKIPQHELSDVTLRERIREDLVEISRQEAISGRFHAVAMLVTPGKDVHFLRRDEDGTWSHKLGDWHPQNQDSENFSIRNPETAAIYSYGQFAGYFTIPPGGILYRPHCPRDLESCPS